jgi:hypothetical protein
MFRSKNLLPDLERFLIERFGLGVLTDALIKPGEVSQALRRVWMFRP